MTRRMVCVGSGGIASWLLPGLCHFLEFRDPGSALLIVDGDAFEPKNAERQDFSEYGPKAEVKAFELTRRFPRTILIPMVAWVVPDEVLVGEEEAGDRVGARALLDDGDVVFAIVDNFAARRLLFDAARHYDNIDVIAAGNGEDLSASAYLYRRRAGRDVTDHPVIMHEAEYLVPHDRNPGELSCAERAELDGGHQLLLANFAAASLALTMVHRFIFHDEDPVNQAEMYLDLQQMSLYAANRGADEDSIARVDELLGTPVATTAIS